MFNHSENLKNIIRHSNLTLISVHDTPVIFSAGIGRTGTFIALDALVTATSNGQKVNISDYIENMRKDRMNMIQTKVNFHRHKNDSDKNNCKMYSLLYSSFIQLILIHLNL